MKRKSGITLYVLLIFALALFVFIHQQLAKEGEPTKLKPDVEAKIESLFLKPDAVSKIGTTRWKVNSSEKRIKIFVWNLTPENRKFDGMKVDGWTVEIIEDEEFKREVGELNAELAKRLANASASWITSYDPRTGSKEVTVWVHYLTEDAKKLDNATIFGWKVKVYKAILPPQEIVLGDQRIKELLKGKEYNITEVKSRQSGRKLLVDVYINIKDPEETIVATVDVVEGKVIEIKKKLE